MPFCPNCGRQIQEADTFCPSCGANLRRTTPVAVPQNIPYTGSQYDGEASSARTFTLVAMVVQAIFLVLIVISAIGFYALYSSILTHANNSQTTAVATFPGTTVTYTNPLYGVSTGFALGFVFIFLGVGIVVSFIWIVLDYLMIYKNLGSPSS